jgi:RNA-directed DNA polymerase
MENNRLFPTQAGTPQGGIASPVLANLTLDGMESAIRAAIDPKHDKVNFIRYADDCAVTGDSKEILEEKVKPAVIQFLDKRALALSEEKTVITHITEGFNFLGQNVRKYGQKLLIKPTRQSVRSVLEKARAHIKKGHGNKAEVLVRKLEPAPARLGQLPSARRFQTALCQH